jgi:hypothetical protein
MTPARGRSRAARSLPGERVCKSAGSAAKCRFQAATTGDAEAREELDEPVGLRRAQRERSLRPVAFPDAEPDVLRLIQIDGNPQSAIAELVYAVEVLDDLRPERCPTPRAETKAVVNTARALATRPHFPSVGNASCSRL